MKREMTIIGEIMRRPGPVDIEEAIASIGLDIQTETLDADALSVVSVSDMVLSGKVQEGLTRSRTRMVMAHVLGHHLLHADLLNGRGLHIDVKDPARRPNGPLLPKHDAQADRFAITMLVPPFRLSVLLDAGASSRDLVQEFGLTERFFSLLTQGVEQELALE